MLTVLVVAFGGLGTAQVATADVSYNVGYVSEYYFRGICRRAPLRVQVSITKKMAFISVHGVRM